MASDPTLVPPGTLPTTFIPTTSAGNVGYMVMSYPGRPPMVPGIPMPPGMGMPYMPIGAPPPLPGVMSGVMPMGPMMGGPPLPPPLGGPPPPPVRPYRPPPPAQVSAPPTITARPKVSPPVRYLPPQPDGPVVTVFVGNITEKAPDQMIRFILSACGHVTSWKRVQAFGFCEFGNPDAGLRAIRLLHDYEIGGKKLVVKVDAKTKTVLDEYKNEKRKKAGSSSPLQDETNDEDDYMDDEMKATDKAALDRIAMILSDYENEMKNFVPPQVDDQTKPAPDIKPVQPPQVRQDSTTVDLTETNIDDDRRDLITREIGKFREIMKKQEEEKEVERKKREEKEKEREKRDRSPSSMSSRDRGKSHDRSVTPDTRRHHKSSRHRTKSRSRERDREREKERDREVERSRERDRERERERERDREKERDSKSEKDLLREKEEEEEAKERKKLERKAREKEAAYQERLRAWESRERHKVKEAAKEKEKKRLKEEEREKEAKRLKEFLEDYDDERDDIKYYKGRELAKRLEEREKEMEMDAKDRQKEKEELAELKAKIFSGDSEDPNAEFARALKAREELYKPKLIINVNEEQNRTLEKEERDREKLREKEREREKEVEREKRDKDRDRGDREREDKEWTDERRKTDAVDKKNQQANAVSPAPSSPAEPPPEPVSNHTSPDITNHEKHHAKNHNSPPVADKKKKKLDVKEVFNNDEDEENNLGNKKRKLVPLDYGDDKKKNAKDQEKKEEHAKSQEEKRKHIKSLIDRIPTDKTALFSYYLDWAAVDNQLMERRIRPWINKKIIEYIGEPEPTLVDFICSKVMAGSAPQGILDDVQMVLDEEAEVFVVKMWRLLIYEIEAKKLGLVK